MVSKSRNAIIQTDPSDLKYSYDEIIDIIMRDYQYYQSSNGGVTLSGGEPLLQNTDSLLFLIQQLKRKGIKISIETTLHAPWSNISKIAPYIDLFLIDLKVVGDTILHQKLTSKEDILIQENIKKLLELKVNIKFRMVIIPKLNNADENFKSACDFLKSINYNSIELLKYHNLYEEKAKKMGLKISHLI
jgi:pyruvate formate lyase activating enzyme